MAKGGYNKRRIEAKHQAERDARKRARRNRKIGQWGIGAALLAITGTVLALTLTGTKVKPLSNPTPTPTPSSSPTTALPAGCTKAGPVAKKAVKYSKPPMTINKNKTYIALLKTSCGDMTVALDAKNAPLTVNNFVFLAKKHFYDNTIFHRVIANFGGNGTDMIQGGDAVATNGYGTGGPGYQFADENPAPFNKPGFLAMANSGPNTNGSQFFILNGPWSGGNAAGSGKYSVFGQVTSGLEVVHRIAISPEDPQSNRPNQDVVLISVTIEEK